MQLRAWIPELGNEGNAGRGGMTNSVFQWEARTAPGRASPVAGSFSR